VTSPALVGEAGEHELLARIRARVGPPPSFVSVGIGDDAAVVAPERHTADVLTTDALVDGVHFERRLVPPRAIGHKALAVNLSDLAAMGATPRVALLSLGLPRELAVAEFDEVLDGLVSLAERHHVALVGGNITRSDGPLFLDVTAVGSVRPRRILKRSTARAGDVLFVSGTVGAAAAGLAWLRRLGPAALDGPDAEVAGAAARHAVPEPRVRLGSVVARSRVASACMDTSDGLADAVHQLAASSRLGADVLLESLPLDPAVLSLHPDPAEGLTLALGASDDYELLFAVPRRRVRGFKAAARQAGTLVTPIGTLRATAGVSLLQDGHERPWPAGYVHFQS
jgi:thiamine-monophosphate kinase